ncbi:hypothetical protein MMC24_002952 [Lignoscripta atroalba]|nr:hypothetical protein [Lignoscripta atroalba]
MVPCLFKSNDDDETAASQTAEYKSQIQGQSPSLTSSDIHLTDSNTRPTASLQATASLQTRPRTISIAERRSGSLGTPTPPPRVEIAPTGTHQHQSNHGFPLSNNRGVPTADDQSRETIIERSAPIAIPLRPKRASRPTTPLTARPDSPGHYFPFFDQTPQKPQISRSRQPTDQQHQPQRHPNSTSPEAPPNQFHLRVLKPRIVVKASAAMRQDQASPLYTPSSPLSPSMPISLHPPHNQPSSRRTQHNLHIASLPRFHPANYQSANSSLISTPNRSGPPSALLSPRSPQPHQRQLSDAHKRLHRYQLELITRPSNSIGSSTTSANPKTPHLIPCRSPGPATPLMLEEQGDYMTAGASSSLSALGEGLPREHVDEIIRIEKERRMYPGAHSGRGSPAVSPAGGRG